MAEGLPKKSNEGSGEEVLSLDEARKRLLEQAAAGDTEPSILEDERVVEPVAETNEPETVGVSEATAPEVAADQAENDPYNELSFAQLEKRWHDLTVAYSTSYGDATSKKLATDAYEKLKSPELTERLKRELQDARNKYGKLFDKSSEASRLVAADVTARYDDLNNLIAWQAKEAEKAPARGEINEATDTSEPAEPTKTSEPSEPAEPIEPAEPVVPLEQPMEPSGSVETPAEPIAEASAGEETESGEPNPAEDIDDKQGPIDKHFEAYKKAIGDEAEEQRAAYDAMTDEEKVAYHENAQTNDLADKILENLQKPGDEAEPVGADGAPDNTPPTHESEPPTEPTVDPTTTEPGEPTTDPTAEPSPEPLLPYDEAELERLRRAYIESPTAETKQALSDYVETHTVEKMPLNEAYDKAYNERISEIRAEVSALEGEGGVKYGDRLDAALRSYAELKANDETYNGNIRIGKWTVYRGRAKREAKLKERESELMAAKIAYELAVQSKIEAAQLYFGNEQQVKAQRRNDLLTRVRELDKQTRDATNDVLDARQDRGGWLRKAAIGIGNWLRGGGKVKKWLKAGGTGLVVTGGTKILASVAGAGFPIGTLLVAGVGAGASLAVRTSAKTAALNDLRKESQGRTAMSDAEFEELRASTERNEESGERGSEYIIKKIFENSREQGRERVDKANKEARDVMLRYGVGAAAGTLASLGWDLVNQQLSGTHPPDGAGNDKLGKPAVVDGSGVGADMGNGGGRFEWPRGASKITSDEGWYHQFQDMGMSSKEAQALFADKDVMKQLVKIDAAYVDNSSTIGGYGINMPANGHLSKKAMEIIGTAMKAKGF